MRNTILFVIGGLMLAGIIHIVTVLSVPYFATNDAWAEMQRFGRAGTFHVLPLAEAGSEPLTGLDPRLLQAVCRFTLEDGPVRITGSMPSDFWSIAIFDRRGRNAYSINDRAADGVDLDLAVITPVQMAQLRQDPSEAMDSAIVIELPISEGMALLRVFVADESMLPRARAALETADCAGTL
ncbi:MAG: DUF1254 domain-containing protein [Rhizobiales bacterium]|nr:DUF1254 domain-containing protein [Hyphomicrobiales bacterium]